MTIVKIKKYRGANILILNNYQDFLCVIFYKGKFYANTFEISKAGEYTEKEYIQALDAVQIAARTTVNIIKERSSVINKLKQYVTITLSFFGINRTEEDTKTS